MKASQKLPALALLCLTLLTLACGIISLPAAAPTATLPPPVESPLKSEMVGQWKVVNGGPWEGVILSFSENGKFSISGGTKGITEEGSYYFTSEDTIVFRLPDYQGTMIVALASDASTLTVTNSKEPFGMIYSIQKVK